MKKEVPSLVKWAGGKKQLLEQFKSYFPKKIERYFEPFVGGGAVAFFILKNYSPKEAFFSDINEELINVYKVIKNKRQLNELMSILNKHKKSHNEDTYYKIREIEPGTLSKVERAARFIYLNKTCFNGLYRVNSKGKFNVPIGDQKNPGIYEKEQLLEISALLKNAQLEVKQFFEIAKEVKKGDFIYFDPPYDPLKKDSFTAYSKEKFLDEEQIKLRDLFSHLHKKGCKVMLSNSDTPFIRDLYKDYNINTVQASRMINSDASKRGKINEVLVTNYLH